MADYKRAAGAKPARWQKVCLDLARLQEVSELVLMDREELVLRVLQNEIEPHQAEPDRGGLMLPAVAIVLFADGCIDGFEVKPK